MTLNDHTVIEKMINKFRFFISEDRLRNIISTAGHISIFLSKQTITIKMVEKIFRQMQELFLKLRLYFSCNPVVIQSVQIIDSFGRIFTSVLIRNSSLSSYV